MSLNISETITQLNNIIIFLKEYRTDEGFQKTLEKTKTLANELQSKDNFPVPTQIRRRNTQFAYDYMNHETNLFMAQNKVLKLTFSTKFFDTAIQSINERFSQLTEHSNLF